mgnify:CR=1 FL=1
MDIQKRIKDLMEERGWTDYRLAMESGLSHSTVSNMFKRNNAPTIPTLEAICKAFGITLSQFTYTNPAFSKCLRNIAFARKPPMIAPTMGARNSTTSIPLEEREARVFM